MAFFEIEIFCPSNDTVKEMKRQATDWKKIFAKCIADRGLVSRTSKKYIWVNDLHRPFTQEHTQMANKHMKRSFTTLVIREIQIKISWGFPDGAVVKNPPANAGDTGSSPGLGRSHMPRSN